MAYAVGGVYCQGLLDNAVVARDPARLHAGGSTAWKQARALREPCRQAAGKILLPGVKSWRGWGALGSAGLELRMRFKCSSCSSVP